MRYRLVIVAALALLGAYALVACASVTEATTPEALKTVPASQAAALEVAIENIKAGREGWTDASALLPILEADKEAWDQFDRFYHPSGASQ